VDLGHCWSNLITQKHRVDVGTDSFFNSTSDLVDSVPRVSGSLAGEQRSAGTKRTAPQNKFTLGACEMDHRKPWPVWRVDGTLFTNSGELDDWHWTTKTLLTRSGHST